MDHSQPKFIPEMSPDLVPSNGHATAAKQPNRPVFSPPVYALFLQVYGLNPVCPGPTQNSWWYPYFSWLSHILWLRWGLATYNHRFGQKERLIIEAKHSTLQPIACSSSMDMTCDTVWTSRWAERTWHGSWRMLRLNLELFHIVVYMLFLIGIH